MLRAPQDITLGIPQMVPVRYEFSSYYILYIIYRVDVAWETEGNKQKGFLDEEETWQTCLLNVLLGGA